MRSITTLPLILLAALNLVQTERAVLAQENARLKKPAVRFDDQVLHFAFEGENPGTVFEEFIPAGETLERWTRLASIREHAHIDEPRQIGAQLMDMLRDKNPQAPAAISENPATGEVVVDFLLGAPDGSFVEFNIFKYSKNPRGGIIAEQFALRAYDADIETFLEQLPAVRHRLVPLMAQHGLKRQ